MDGSRTARVPGGGPHFARVAAGSDPLPDDVQADLARAILKTRQHLMSVQQPPGHWVGELEGDTILESEYILLLAYLGRHETQRAARAARYVLRNQLPSGGWALYPGGAVDTSASVKAYFALKLVGYSPACEEMQRARAAILAHGGADAVNSFTRFYLALLGQISYERCPEVPPEIVLLPKWLPIHLYKISAWSRTILVPLSIMSALQPVASIPAELGIAELMLRKPHEWPPLQCPGQRSSGRAARWARAFRTLDRVLKFSVRRGWLPRRRALRAAEQWMLDRFVGSEGLGAIFPPMIWSIIALKCLGYADESPELQYCYEHLEGLVIEEGETARLQPCKSPVWDTAISLRALLASGTSPDEAECRRAAGWLLEQEIRAPGDWRETVGAEPGGWCFEYANQFYADVDDTAMVLMALEPLAGGARPSAAHLWRTHPGRKGHAGPSSFGIPAAGGPGSLTARVDGACQRAMTWLLALQNRDGGWGAFDRNNDAEFLCHVPFADHNAMIDPSTPDLAGRVLEMLGQCGWGIGDPEVDRAVAYLRRTQEADGSWFGRWGVNHIYGTWQAITGLAAVGVWPDDPCVAAGANWLLAHQQPAGSWGESPDSYAEPHLRGQGPATASQTAWAVLGLVAAGRHTHPATVRGVQFLLEHQQRDGTWEETDFTGTGFPRVFYLRYHMYPIYFPLLALSVWARAMGVRVEALASGAELGAPAALGTGTTQSSWRETDLEG